MSGQIILFNYALSGGAARTIFSVLKLTFCEGKKKEKKSLTLLGEGFPVRG